MGVPGGTKAHPLMALEKLIVDFYKGIQRDGKSTLAYKGGILERVSSLRQSRSGGLRTLVNKSGSLMNFLSLQQTALVVPSQEQKKRKRKKNNKKPRFF